MRCNGEPRGSEWRGGLGFASGPSGSPDSAPPLPRVQGGHQDLVRKIVRRPWVLVHASGVTCLGGQFWVIVAAGSSWTGRVEEPSKVMPRSQTSWLRGS